MKKKTMILLLVILAVVLFACSKRDFNGISSAYTYSDHERYSAGSGQIADTVKKIDISWIDGKVNFEYHDGKDIMISETAAATLDATTTMHWLVDGDTLYVKYAASGFKTGKNLKKVLSVRLPDGIELENVTMNVVSTVVQMGELDAERINIQTVSGNAEGSFKQTDEVMIHTVSGDVSISAEQVKRVSVSTVSGNAACRFVTMPETISIDSVSGNATLYLPEDAGFHAQMDSVSGKVSGGMPMEQKGKGNYGSGDESCKITVETVSGNLKIEKLNK